MIDPNPKARFCGQRCKNQGRIKRYTAEWHAEMATRTCAGCGTSMTGKRRDSKWCSNACGVKGRPSRKDVARKARLKKKFGVTIAELDAMLQRQHGTCAICKGSDPKHPQGTWAVDHDHVTQQVRGLLCSRCNTGIGQLQDDPDIIAAAASYVRLHRQMVLPLSP
jgi:hypothetical protein